MTAELNMPIAMTATLENRAKRYEASLRLSGAIASGSPDDLARDLAAGLRPVLSFDFLDVLVFKEGTNEVLWQLVGQGPALSLDVEMKDTGAWWIYENQQKLMIRDWNEDKRFQGFRSALSLQGIEARSVCGVPLTTPHRRIGVLGIASLQVNAYSEEDQHFLSFLAEHVALAVDNALNADAAMKAQADLEKQNERLKFLLDLTNRITSNLELRELLRAISASIRRVMECDGVSISLPTSEATTFKIYALDFPQAKGLIQEELTLSSHAPAFERAVNALKPVVVNPLDPSEYSPESYRIVAGEGIKAQCLVPLVSRGRVLGMLILGRMEEHAFCSEELEFLGQMAGQISIALENALAYQDISDLKDKLAQEKLYLEEEIRSELSFEQIIGKSPALMHVLGLVDTVAPTDSTVLLLGETGTGKELIARAIHDHSRRKDRTFVKLNCAAIPTGLLESELFGHEKGAFTGAISSKVGRLELADQGTLFLDEVGRHPS